MIGETLGRKYKITSLLGQGGMGSVYEAEQTDTRERVAIKVLHSHLIDTRVKHRFQREADAARSIRSEHIARVLDAATDEATGRLYLVTERLEGEDLQKLLTRVGPLTVTGALHIARQTLFGLRDAHAEGVIHRDIKPANIFVAKRRGSDAVSVKLLDFGIAKVRPDPYSKTESLHLTTTGGFLGSPLYMSPEQVQNSRDVDHRTDLWSAASVLYAALSGRAPHEHLTTFGQLLVAICTVPAPPLRDVAPWVPGPVADVVHKALSLYPDERYATATAMLEAICDLLPPGDIDPDMLVSSGERPRATSSGAPHVVLPSSPAEPIRGDDPTEIDSGSRPRPVPLSEAPPSKTLGSAPEEDESRPAARSAVPSLGGGKKTRQITVDPRRLLGETSELWTFSLDVHKNVTTLIARIWKALRRSGAKLPPMSYGDAWILFEPRTGRTIPAGNGPPGERLPLEEAGIRPGTILWVLPGNG